MTLNQIYKEYYNKFSKTNMQNISKKHLGRFNRFYHRLFKVYLILSFILMMLTDSFRINNLNIQGGFTLMAFTSAGLAFFFLAKYKNILNINFKEYHHLSNTKHINFETYRYYDLLQELKNDQKFMLNRKELIKIADLNIEHDKNSFFQNPVTIIFLSFIIAIFVNKMTSEHGLSTTTLGTIVFLTLTSLFFYYLYFESKAHKISNHIEFKSFIINSLFDLPKSDKVSNT